MTLGPPVRVAAALLVACALAAIVWEWIDPSLTLGAANDAGGSMRFLSVAFAALLAAVLCVLLSGGRSHASRRMVDWCCALVFTFAGLQLAMAFVDRTWASAQADSALGGPYYERSTRDGRPVLLKKGDPSRLGFRTDEPLDAAAGGACILFLGDSYTEGSGSGMSCNYPQVAGRVLSAALGREIAVVNAGVAGYGPVEAANLLDYLAERGVRCAVVVYSLFLENDFTDDLPGTTRRASAGMPFRVPDATLIELFHPLHSALFHWAVFVTKTRLAGDAGWQQSARPEGACASERDAARATAQHPPELLALARRRLDANYGPRARSAERVVVDAVEHMQATARSLGAAFVLVVFPDRILVDDELRSAALHERDPGDHDTSRLARFVYERWSDRVDVTPALSAEAAPYRPNDTHLSDAGNEAAGRAVAAALGARADVRRALVTPNQ